MINLSFTLPQIKSIIDNEIDFHILDNVPNNINLEVYNVEDNISVFIRMFNESNIKRVKIEIKDKEIFLYKTHNSLTLMFMVSCLDDILKAIEWLLKEENFEDSIN